MLSSNCPTFAHFKLIWIDTYIHSCIWNNSCYCSPMAFMQFTHGIFLLLIISVIQTAKGSNDFKRCYYTSNETHCFEVQYDEANSRWLTSSVDDARRRCSQRDAHLVVIKNEEVNQLFQQFKRESGNPVSNYNIWTDALRVDDYNNNYTWHWISRNLPNIPASDVHYTYDASYYAAALELKDDDRQYHLAAKRPGDYYNYVCEYDESNCSSVVSNAKTSDGRCYIAYSENATWYEARNRCLMGSGDLASFKNVKSFNFTSLFDFGPPYFPFRTYWIGLRFTWYIWNTSGTEIGYLKWMRNDTQWSTSRCLVLNSGCSNGCSMTPHTCDNTGDVYVVCHTVTSLPTTTTEASTSTIHYTLTPALAVNVTSGITVNTTKLPNSDQTTNGSSQKGSVVPLAVGIGVGVGVPVIIAIIVIVICVVRRRHSSMAHSSSSAVHAASAPSKISRDEEDEENLHVEGPTYSTVNLSSTSKMAADADQKKSAGQETNYAALNIL